MRRRLRLLVLLPALLVLPLAACGGDDASSDDAPSDAASGEVSGEDVYEANCARCHGPNGEGGVGLPLGNGAVEDSLSLEGQIEVITEGRNAMPAWGDQLSEEEIRAVATYEREELGR